MLRVMCYQLQYHCLVGSTNPIYFNDNQTLQPIVMSKMFDGRSEDDIWLYFEKMHLKRHISGYNKILKS